MTDRKQQLLDLIAALPKERAATELKDPTLSLQEQTKRLIASLTPKEREVLEQRFGGPRELEDILKVDRTRELEELDKEEERMKLEDEERAAARKARRRELSIVARTTASIVSQAQWLATSSAMDHVVWEKIAAAIAALPADATHQQIALAQATAICDAKQLIADGSCEQLDSLYEQAEQAEEELADFDRQSTKSWGSGGLLSGVVGAAAAALFMPSMFRATKLRAEFRAEEAAEKATEKEG